MRPLRAINSVFVLFLTVLGIALTGCNNNEPFTQGTQSQFFIQDYNPEFLDVLWMVDTRSQMSVDSTQKARLVEEARKFFARLDLLTTSAYRMAIVSHDVDLTSPGMLLPKYSNLVLTKNFGSVNARAAYFASIFANTYNLKTGGMNKGFDSVRSALLGNPNTLTSATFSSASNIPLVLVFITDSDDRSIPGSGDAVDFFSNEIIKSKDKPELVKAYSVNYTATGSRCFTQASPDISSAGFEDRYFRLADKIGGDKADICGSWADKIDLTGLKLKDLPKRFKLDNPAVASSVVTSVYDSAGKLVTADATFDAATNEIVFAVAPPAGTTILVTYSLLH